MLIVRLKERAHAEVRHLLATSAYATGAACDAERDSSGGGTPLLWSAFQGDRESFAALLERNCNVHACDKHGMGVVHFLAMSGMADELRAALALLSDFDIDAKRGAEGQKKTALMCAAAYGQLSTTRLLIELGADVTPCSSGSGLNALQLIATTSRSMAAARTAAWARSEAGALALAEAEEGVRVHELYGALSADDLCTQTWKEVDNEIYALARLLLQHGCAESSSKPSDTTSRRLGARDMGEVSAFRLAAARGSTCVMRALADFHEFDAGGTDNANYLAERLVESSGRLPPAVLYVAAIGWEEEKYNAAPLRWVVRRCHPAPLRSLLDVDEAGGRAAAADDAETEHGAAHAPGRTREDVIRVAIQACEKHISSQTRAGVKQVAMLASLERAQTWLERARGFSELEWAVDALDAESLVAQIDGR